jgi:hypothetical protein
VLIVALCAYDVYAAAIPDDAESADKAVQARPAPVAPAGARGKKKSAGQQENKNAARDETAVEGGAKVERRQRIGQKKAGAQNQAGKGKQQMKVRKGKLNSNKKPTATNANREELSNKRNKNQFNKTPVDKIDRNLFIKTAAGDDEYVDYGAPQAPPAPGNRLVKIPNFAAHQKPSDSSMSLGGNKPVAGSSLGNVPQKAILPFEQPIRSDGYRPRVIVEGPEFYQPNPDSVVGNTGNLEIMPVVGSVALPDKAKLPPTIDSQPEYIARPAVMPEMSIMQGSP